MYCGSCQCSLEARILRHGKHGRLLPRQAEIDLRGCKSRVDLDWWEGGDGEADYQSKLAVGGICNNASENHYGAKHRKSMVGASVRGIVLM